MTISDACAILGERSPVKPSHAARVCSECGSDELMWGVEVTGSHPFGTGYDIEFCGECGEPTGDRMWIGR